MSRPLFLFPVCFCCIGVRSSVAFQGCATPYDSASFASHSSPEMQSFLHGEQHELCINMCQDYHPLQ
ncbi:hypothetical protein WN943_027709 [Citrus x changshan-huyou]